MVDWGGQLRLAAKAPGQEKIGWFLDYLLKQMKREKIQIRLGTRATEKRIVQGKPDRVILATGAVPQIPDWPGIENKFVYNGLDILEGKKKIENQEGLVVGGGLLGCEVAPTLASRNNKVILVEMGEGIAPEVEPINRMDLIAKIQESKIKVLLGRTVERIEPDGVILSHQGIKEEKIKADFVVFTLGGIATKELAKKLADRIEEVHLIGDGLEPRKIIDAVYEGFMPALRI